MNADVVRAQERWRAWKDVAALIQSLPSEVGDRVRWPHNGVVWERTGEDSWVPQSTHRQHDLTWTSDHIVLHPFEYVDDETHGPIEVRAISIEEGGMGWIAPGEVEVPDIYLNVDFHRANEGQAGA